MYLFFILFSWISYWILGGNFAQIDTENIIFEFLFGIKIDVEMLKTRVSWKVIWKCIYFFGCCFYSTCVLTCVHLRVCLDSVDRIQQLKREYQLARREGMVAPYEEPDPRRRGLENDLHRVQTWNSPTLPRSRSSLQIWLILSSHLFVLSSGCFALTQTNNRRTLSVERARVHICQVFRISYQGDHYFYCIILVIKAVWLSAARCSLTLMAPAGTELMWDEAIAFLLRTSVRHQTHMRQLSRVAQFFPFVFLKAAIASSLVLSFLRSSCLGSRGIQRE